jgi:flagellar basal-body rod protein FlgB
MVAIEGTVLDRVEQALRFRSARQAVLAANVANADTPGYRRSDLVFVGALERAHGLARTDPRHVAGSSVAPAGARRELDDSPARPDGNNVNPDREPVLLARNASAFVQQTEVMSRLLTLRRIAVTGGR